MMKELELENEINRLRRALREIEEFSRLRRYRSSACAWVFERCEIALDVREPAAAGEKP